MEMARQYSQLQDQWERHYYKFKRRFAYLENCDIKPEDTKIAR